MAEPPSPIGSPPTLRSPGAVRHDVSIGVDIGGTKIAVGLVGPGGRVEKSYRHESGPSGQPERTVALIVECVREGLGPAADEAIVLGIGVAGQVSEDGVVLGAPNLRWSNFPLARRLSDELSLPVRVTNDVRAVTYGEWHFGAGHGERDLVCIFVGTGVGGGIVADGRLYSGATHTAGEVGHMTIVTNGRPCHCRSAGCLEAYVGGWAIAERTRQAVSDRPREGERILALAGSLDRIEVETLRDAYRAKDPLAEALVHETTEYLASGLLGLVNLLNPELVVMGGGVLEGLPEMIANSERLVRERALAGAAKELRVSPASLGAQAGVVGSAMFARELETAETSE